MQMMTGKSIVLFLVEGTAGGLLTAEIRNWTGLVLAAPRSSLPALLQRSEVRRTGVYILVGDDPGSLDGTIAYIGEGDDVGRRLGQHARAEDQDHKDFWSRAVVLTSKDANMTKAHARYLEARLLEVAQKAGRAALVNKKLPPPPSLPEADASDMEYFISQAEIVLSVLGVTILRSVPTSQGSSGRVDERLTGEGAEPSPIFELRVEKEGIHARAQEVEGEFTVFAGSSARRAWKGVDIPYKRLRKKLEDESVLKMRDDGKVRVFTRNVVFTSPSAAAAVVLGRSANGRSEWIIEGTTTSYASWLDSAVKQALGAVAPQECLSGAVEPLW
ncbi:GIY-YIG nuclease family protein [Aciditerrimonas ferrireducens]|jgi:hypothetical protein|uniref:GIY-YIG nuclease family protein n=1 Tax=Aciditerrimonas ferrireducens TaxID=667306 RepID=A0ABV6C2M9_9ACTN